MTFSGKNDKEDAKASSFLFKRESFGFIPLLILILITLTTLVVCVCIGSVRIPVSDTVSVIFNSIWGNPVSDLSAAPIILSVRLPRVLCVALTGASLSLCGVAMQGLLRNPLADGSTLGVSSGASLGAVIAIAFNITLPILPFAGTCAMAIVFAFISMVLILTLAHRLDFSLSTNTIILIGVVYSMFVSSIMSLIITLASDRVKQITFWTMGSLAGSSYKNVLLLLGALLLCGTILRIHARELNAFAIGENNARHIGINVKRVKLTILITVSILIGICVSIGGTIGFVGLVTPHLVRMFTGPNHKRLIPACVFGGATFLMLCDLVARTILSPLELPIGVVTSFIGAILFIVIAFKLKKRHHG